MARETAQEFCHRRIVESASSGLPLSTVAAVLGVTVATVTHWRKLGPQDRRESNVGGRPRKLTDSQLTELATLLEKGAVFHGWHNDLWTTKRMAEVIRRHFNVPCRPNQAWSIVTKYLGWSSQRPIQQMRAADELEVARWLREDYPAIISKARRRAAHLVFIDESGFMLMPTLRRTYAPRGRPPVCRVSDPHAKVSVIGALTVSLRRKHFGFHYSTLGDNQNCRGEDVAAFLAFVSRQCRGPLTIVWDAIPIHRSRPVLGFLNHHRTAVPELFPRYAAGLNPVDKVWFYLKYDCLANFAPESLADLRGRLEMELRRLQTRPHPLRSLFQMTKLPMD